MANDERIRARVEKLLRTAAPNSGASDNERNMAAHEAARLFVEHNFTVAFAPPKRPRQTKPPSDPFAPFTHGSPGPAWSGLAWTEVDLTSDCVCAACGRMILTAEVAWYDPVFGQYRHYDITCDQ